MSKKDLESILNILYYVLSVIAYVFLFVLVTVGSHITSFTWLFFIITVVIPFGLVHLPFLLEKKWKSELILSTIISLVYLIVFVPSVEYGIISYSKSFSVNKWKEHTELRYLMIDDLEENYQLVGMNKEDITKLLGKADYALDSDYCYYTNNDIDVQYYCLTFKNDTVVDIFNNRRVYE